MKSKTLTFTVTVPVVPGVPVARAKSYIQDAVECWSGQFNPDEDPLFYAYQDKTKVVRQTKRRKPTIKIKLV